MANFSSPNGGDRERPSNSSINVNNAVGGVSGAAGSCPNLPEANSGQVGGINGGPGTGAVGGPGPENSQIANATSQAAPLKVAIKILDKSKINNNETRTRQLVQEIRVHWALEKCEGVIKVLELFEDEQFVYIILEYQK
jgi:hypothetical protein